VRDDESTCLLTQAKLNRGIGFWHFPTRSFPANCFPFFEFRGSFQNLLWISMVRQTSLFSLDKVAWLGFYKENHFVSQHTSSGGMAGRNLAISFISQTLEKLVNAKVTTFVWSFRSRFFENGFHIMISFFWGKVFSVWQARSSPIQRFGNQSTHAIFWIGDLGLLISCFSTNGLSNLLKVEIFLVAFQF